MNQPSPSTHLDKHSKTPWLKDMKSRYPKRDLPYTDYSKPEVPDEDSFLCKFDAGKVRGKYMNEEM